MDDRMNGSFFSPSGGGIPDPCLGESPVAKQVQNRLKGYIESIPKKMRTRFLDYEKLRFSHKKSGSIIFG
jgi:hypothetical protein